MHHCDTLQNRVTQAILLLLRMQQWNAAAVSDAAEFDSSATAGTLPSANPCSVKDGTTCGDASSSTEINAANVSHSENVVVSTSSEHPTVSTFTQSMVCSTAVNM